MSDEEVIMEERELDPLLPESETKADIVAPPSPPPTTNHEGESAPAPSAPLNNLNHINSPLSNGPLREEEDKISPISPEEEDQVDRCCPLPSGDDKNPGANVISGEPKSGEYAKIMELLREAEESADPEYEEKKRKMEFLTKFNPRGGPNAPLGPVDYCCNLFQCCALCIEG